MKLPRVWDRLVKQTFPQFVGRADGQPRGGRRHDPAFRIHVRPAGDGEGLGVTQAEAAKRLGVTQPRLYDLLHGKIGKFSLDALLTLATRAGLRVRIKVQSAA